MSADCDLWEEFCHCARRVSLAGALLLASIGGAQTACDHLSSGLNSMHVRNGRKYPEWPALQVCDILLLGKFLFWLIVHWQIAKKSSWTLGFAVKDNPIAKLRNVYSLQFATRAPSTMALMTMSRCTLGRPITAHIVAVRTPVHRWTRPASLQSQFTPCCASLRSVTSSFAGEHTPYAPYTTDCMVCRGFPHAC